MIYSTYERKYVDGELLRGQNYYLEIIRPTLYEKGSTRIFRHANPNSLSSDACVYKGQYEDVEDAKWVFNIWDDPIETIYGDF